MYYDSKGIIQICPAESHFYIYILAYGTYNKSQNQRRGEGSMFLDGLDELDQRIRPGC